MLKIEVYTDGSSQNPGVGGFAAILKCGGQERVIRNFSTERTTNNSMELRPVLETIKWLNEHQKQPCKVTFFTDSQYIVDCASIMMKDGTKKKTDWFEGRPNEELWMEFIRACKKGGHIASFVKVKGHNGNELNERCDKMAKEEMVKARHALYEKLHENA